MDRHPTTSDPCEICLVIRAARKPPLFHQGFRAHLNFLFCAQATKMLILQVDIPVPEKSIAGWPDLVQKNALLGITIRPT